MVYRTWSRATGCPSTGCPAPACDAATASTQLSTAPSAASRFEPRTIRVVYAAAHTQPRRTSGYFDLRCLLRTYCTDGLIGLSVRWVQPIQQQGLRFPSFRCKTTRSTCSARVSAFFTDIAQHIHSLRASGVKLSHAAMALESAAR